MRECFLYYKNKCASVSRAVLDVTVVCLSCLFSLMDVGGGRSSFSLQKITFMSLNGWIQVADLELCGFWGGFVKGLF